MKQDRSTDMMNLSALSKEELTQNLRSLQQPVAQGEGPTSDNLEEMVQELQVHRIELEMQNRALSEAELELESALQRYCDLYDHLPIGCLTLTRKGRIVQANLTAADWLRSNRTQLVDRYLNSFLDAFDAGRFAVHLEGCVQTGTEQTIEVTLRLENGRLLAVHLTSRLAPSSEGAEARVHTVLTHVSMLPQAATLKKDIDLEQENLTRSIAGDLRTPLVAISKFAQAMLNDRGTELGPESRSMVERMQRAAVRMEATLQEVLEYCRLGHEQVALDPVSLEELMQHVVMEHRFVIERSRAEIAIDRPLPCVRGARLLLGQVLANVLTSMLKHARSEHAPRLRIWAEQQGNEIVLTVADEGSAPELKEGHEHFRILERHHEQDCFSGGGGGLAIVRRTVEQMNGHVWVGSVVGKGAFLRIGLPAV